MNIADVEVKIEGKRGCGFRKVGGTYLIAGKPSAPCGRLPLPIPARCPCCSAGIKPARGWTWMDPRPLFAPKPCGYVHDTPGSTYLQLHATCPLNDKCLPARAGLLWVGGSFYPTADAYMEEARTMGLSRRIKSVPKDFVVGEHWVMLAHRKCIAPPPTAIPFGEMDRTQLLNWLSDHKAEQAEIDGLCEAGESEEEIDERLADLASEIHAGSATPGIFTFFMPERIEYVCRGDESDEELGRIVARGLTPVRVVNPDKPAGEVVAANENYALIDERDADDDQ